MNELKPKITRTTVTTTTTMSGRNEPKTTKTTKKTIYVCLTTEQLASLVATELLAEHDLPRGKVSAYLKDQGTKILLEWTNEL